MSRPSPRNLLLAAAVGVPVLLAVGWVVVREIALQARAMQSGEDFAGMLAGLHRAAATGEQPLSAPEQAGAALIAADFPTSKPLPRLSRASLAGAAVVEVEGRRTALVHFRANEGALTLFSVRSGAALVPPDAARVVRSSGETKVVQRGPVTLVLWVDGGWLYALATEMAGPDRDLFVELVRRLQAG